MQKKQLERFAAGSRINTDACRHLAPCARLTCKETVFWKADEPAPRRHTACKLESSTETISSKNTFHRYENRLRPMHKQVRRSYEGPGMVRQKTLRETMQMSLGNTYASISFHKCSAFIEIRQQNMQQVSGKKAEEPMAYAWRTLQNARPKNPQRADTSAIRML